MCTLVYKQCQHCPAGSKRDGSAFGCRRIVLSNFIPVDDIEESRDILWAAILVLQIVGMLPDVNAHDGDQTCFSGTFHKRVILVGCGDYFHIAILRDSQPRPARTKNTSSCRAELSLEVVVRAEGSGHLFCKHASGLTPSLGAHDVPKEAMVVVATTRVVELVFLSLRHERYERRFCLPCHGLVQIVDVCLVVEVVVELHGCLVDMWL
mmetsp:Transcript_163786/g.314623  ORF Transcript_163786/g.314623 Transcript_163786/m.314623 type:complete len:208 (-) Transcript_163786:464-1087(-)